MVKLVRNNWAKSKIFLNGKGEEIKWEFIEKIYAFQLQQHISVCPKITKEHVQFERSKMKVKLAVQVLSCSIAAALKYLENDRAHPLFQHSEATREFVQLFNDLFDVFNR